MDLVLNERQTSVEPEEGAAALSAVLRTLNSSRRLLFIREQV